MSQSRVAAILSQLIMILFSASAGADTSGQERAEAAGRGLIGSAAPRLTVKTIDGGTIDLGALYGKQAVYLKFWATWCVPCREQMPHFQHTYETAGSDLAVIAVNAGFNDSLAEIERYRRQVGITMPIVMDDGALGAALKLRVTPQHIVIGRDGRILYVGHLADQRLEAALRTARASAQPATSRGDRPPPDTPRVSVGDPLPARSVRTLDGRSFAFRGAKPDRRTVLVFLSPWCESYLATTRPAISAGCRIARERIAAHAHDPGVRWLGIASGLWAAPEDLRKYRQDHQVAIPLTLDESGTLFRTFQVSDVPTLVVADASGTIVRRVDPGDADGLSKALENL